MVIQIKTQRLPSAYLPAGIPATLRYPATGPVYTSKTLHTYTLISQGRTVVIGEGLFKRLRKHAAARHALGIRPAVREGYCSLSL